MPLRHSGGRGEEVMAGAHDPAPVEALSSACGDRSQSMRREAAMAALPLVYHSTMVFPFCGNLGFLHEHFPLWSYLFTSPHRQQQSLHPVCSPNTTFQHPAPTHICGHPSETGVHRAEAWTICIGLSLSCLSPTSCCVLL